MHREPLSAALSAFLEAPEALLERLEAQGKVGVIQEEGETRWVVLEAEKYGELVRLWDRLDCRAHLRKAVDEVQAGRVAAADAFFQKEGGG